MRFRDLLIVGIGLLCCIVGWWNQGSVNLQPSFQITVKDDETRTYVMAKPLVIDPNGEGSPVLIASTGAGEFSVYDTYFTTGNMESVFVPLSPQKEVHLYGRVLGFGAGSIDPLSPDTVLAVLTDNYKLRAYSSTLRYETVLWEVEVAPPESWYFVLHASVSVVPESIYADDKGIVAVAVKVLNADGVALNLFAAFNGADGKSRWQYLSDSLNDLDDVVREANNTTPLGVDEVRDLFPVPIDGVSGNRADVMIGQRLSVPMLGRLYEKPWTTYREAVVAALPHHYNHPWDAQLRPHALYPQKAAKQQRSKAGAKFTFLRNNRVLRMDADNYGVLGEKLGFWGGEEAASTKPLLNTANNPANLAKQRRRRSPNAFVYHGKAGIEVLHMFTGNTITQVVPLKANDGTYYHDINDDFHIEAIRTQIGPRTAMDGDHSVDLLDDCLGVILTGVPVAEDQVFNSTICDTEGFFGSLDLIHRFVDSDVRGEDAPQGLSTLELLGSKNIVSKTTRSVPPVVVQVHRSLGRGVTQMERYAVFMIDSGLVTCVDPSRRRVLWRTQAGATFSDLAEVSQADNYGGGREADEEKDSFTRPYPHLASYSFYQRSREDDPNHVSGGRSRYRRTDPYVIAVGEHVLSVINTKNGKVVRQVRLPEPPVAPIIVTDFNGDGVNDIIVVTQRHIYGFVGSAQVSTSTVTSLMVLMVALLLLLFIAREMAITKADGVDEYLPPAATPEEILQHKGRAHKRATD